MNPTDRLAIPAQVMTRQVGEQTVILDLTSGTYFGLDPVGARIWALLSEGKSLGKITDSMLEEFEVERGRLEQDVADLLDQLASKGLIQIEEQ